MNQLSSKESFISVVNGVVGLVRDRDEILRVEDARIVTGNISRGHRVHVMNIETFVNLKSIYSQITTFISSDDVMTNLSPLC